MRMVLFAIAVVVATGLVACGESEKAKPLTLGQRLISESDAPGSREDPVEVRLTAGNLDEFIVWPNVSATEIDLGKLKKAGFVSAVHETRFFPKTPGGPHTRDARHVRNLVIQFRSKEGAATGSDLVYANSLMPCPGECAFQIEEFKPSGVPDARGARRYITAKRARETGDAPIDDYTITFADGPFVYEVEGFAGKISKKQVEEIAQRVYDRVKGAPPPGT